jgi:hypothetical protein
MSLNLNLGGSKIADAGEERGAPASGEIDQWSPERTYAPMLVFPVKSTEK